MISERDLSRLIVHGVDDLLHPVANTDNMHSPTGVEEASAVRIDQIDPISV